jgi:hypothetical protein
VIEPSGFERRRPVGEIIARAQRAIDDSSAWVAVSVYCPRNCLVGEVVRTDIGPVWRTPGTYASVARRQKKRLERLLPTIPDDDPVDKWWRVIAPRGSGPSGPIPLMPHLFDDADVVPSECGHGRPVVSAGELRAKYAVATTKPQRRVAMKARAGG